MKNYFDFQLKGKQLLPLWIIFYLVFIIPYCSLIYKLISYGHSELPQKPPTGLILLIIPLILVAMVWTLYYIKIIVQGISLNETTVKCNYKLGKYLGVIFLGLFLSIITLGIYFPWFIRNIQRFYIDNSSWKEKNFSFQGKGLTLFLIFLLSFALPFGIMMFILIKNYGPELLNPSVPFTFIRQTIMFIILVPYIYLIYKWRVDFKYSEYHIKWDTGFLLSIGKILAEIVLSIITFGIYLPLAYLRLYKYFCERTKSNIVENQYIKFGYDIETGRDFLLLWGQLLLCAITLGIYFPWAVCKISQRILRKSYIEKISS